VVDTHCHLDYCEPPDGELIERALAAGVTRLATVGTDGPSIERALEAAREHPAVIAIVGRHPHETEGFGPGDLDEIERAAADPVVGAIGRPGSTTTATTPRARTSGGRSPRSWSWRPGSRCRSRSTRAPRRTTHSRCCASTRRRCRP
jgi:hypothetical protein